MKCAAIEPLNAGKWAPTDRWAGRLPHHVTMNQWPSFAHCAPHPMVNFPQGANEPAYNSSFLLPPRQFFIDWVNEFGVGPYEIVFWYGIFEAKHCAANDIDYVDAWTVGFERENDAIFFKMKWL